MEVQRFIAKCITLCAVCHACIESASLTYGGDLRDSLSFRISQPIFCQPFVGTIDYSHCFASYLEQTKRSEAWGNKEELTSQRTNEGPTISRKIPQTSKNWRINFNKNLQATNSNRSKMRKRKCYYAKHCKRGELRT